MVIKWDPKISQVIQSKDLDAARHKSTKPPGKGLSDIDTSKNSTRPPHSNENNQHSPQGGLKSPTKSITQPVSLQEKELAKLQATLRSQAQVGSTTLSEIMHLAAAYKMRRSKKTRKQVLGLLDEIIELPENDRPEVPILRDILLAEAHLHEFRELQSWNAAALLLAHVDTPGPHQALAQATLARALTQLAIHFPKSLNQHKTPIESCLEQAFYLAEAAALTNHELADSHAALGRLLLIHGTTEAYKDAEVLFQLALKHDPEFDPARLGLANCFYLQGKEAQSLTEVELLLRKGATFPGLWVLRSQLKADAGDLKTALRDIERATQLAPEAGLYHLDAAKIATASGQLRQAESHRQKAQQLLGKYSTFAQADS